VVTADQVRAVALALPRTEERIVRDRFTYRVGRLVYATISADETTMGFGYPKDGRVALVESEPDKFLMPRPSDMRYHWVRARLDALDETEMRELVIDAWRMCAPKKVQKLLDELGEPRP
jgi:hypothetical protein